MMKAVICFALSFLMLHGARAAEQEVTLRRDFGTLVGTLLTPDTGSETVALIIAGSGPTDRNGNSPMGVGANSYRYLAEALRDAGIASLRYDKRAIGLSKYDDPTQIAEVTLEDFIGDAVALAEELSNRGFRKIVLMGHSEGALIALRAAQQSERVSALVTLAGAGYPFDEILELQLAAQLVPGHMELLAEAKQIMTSLKKGERVEMNYHSPQLRTLFNPAVQPFIISTLRYDPRKEIRNVQVPVLIVNGDNDLQVTADNAEALASAQPRARKAIIPGMTHVLKKSDAQTVAEQWQSVYADPSIPLDEELVRTVVAFVREI